VEKDKPSKLAIFAHFRPPWPQPWIGSYDILSSIIHQLPPTYQNSFKLDELFVDRWTYGHRD